MSRKKATLWSLVFSYANLMFPIITGFIFVPIYLKQIPEELYGAWLASGGVLGWLSALDPGISVVVQQKVGYFLGKNEKGGIIKYARAGNRLTYYISTIVLVVGFFVSNYLKDIVGLLSPDLNLVLEINFVISVVATALNFISFSYASISIGLLKTFESGTSSVISNLIGIAITASLLYYRQGLYAISFGMLGRSMMMGMLSYSLMEKHLKPYATAENSTVKISNITGYIGYSAFSRFLVLITQNIDQVLIAKILGPQAVPPFVLSLRGMKLGSTFMTRIGHAVAPGLSNLFGEGDVLKIRNILTKLFDIIFFLIGAFLCLFIALNQSFVELWVGEKFFVGTALSLFMVLSVALFVIKSVIYTVVMNSGAIKFSMTVQAVESVITTLAMLYLIPRYGYWGAITPIVAIPVFMSIPLYLWKLFRCFKKVESKPFYEIVISKSLLSLVGGFCLGYFWKIYPQNILSFLFSAAILLLMYCLMQFLIHKKHRQLVLKYFHVN